MYQDVHTMEARSSFIHFGQLMVTMIFHTLRSTYANAHPTVTKGAYNLFLASAMHQNVESVFCGIIPTDDIVIEQMSGLTAEEWSTHKAAILAPLIEYDDEYVFQDLVKTQDNILTLLDYAFLMGDNIASAKKYHENE